MRLIPAVVLAGVGSLALAGGAYAASRHVMNVDLPDGGVARIAYEGDVPPQVKIVPARDVAAVPIADIDPFARMDAIFTAMARQHALMMRQAAAMAAEAQAQADRGAAPIFVSATNGAPRGGSFTFVSTTTTGNGTCGHSIEVTQRAGEPARRVERSFGDCSASAAPAPRAAPSAAPARPAVPARSVV